MHFDSTSTRYALLLLGCILLLGAGTYFIATKSAEQKREASADVAKLSLEDGSTPFTNTEGEAIDIATYENEIRVVSAWASWCPSCADQLALLDTVAQNYTDVAFIAVNRNENPATARAYLETLPPLENLVVLFDTHDRFFNAIEGYAMPETIIYNTEGKVVVHIRGPLKKEQIEREINNVVTREE